MGITERERQRRRRRRRVRKSKRTNWPYVSLIYGLTQLLNIVGKYKSLEARICCRLWKHVLPGAWKLLVMKLSVEMGENKRRVMA